MQINIHSFCFTALKHVGWIVQKTLRQHEEDCSENTVWQLAVRKMRSAQITYEKAVFLFVSH